MSCSRRQLFRILLVLAAILAAGWLLQTSINCALIIANGNAPPRLYLWADGKGMAPAEDFVQAQTPSNLVVFTHGWIEKSQWPADLARALSARLDKRQWLCGWYDWRRQAQRVNPADVARYGKNTAGAMLGDEIVPLSRHWKHVHLVGHSAGAWVNQRGPRRSLPKKPAPRYTSLFSMLMCRPFGTSRNSVTSRRAPT